MFRLRNPSFKFVRHNSQGETDFQVGVVRFLRMQNFFVFAVPNGNRGDAIKGAKYKRMGQMSGVSDLVIITRNNVYFIEIKNPNGNGRQSDNQKEFQQVVEGFGFTYEIWDKMSQVEEFINKHRGER